MAIRTRGWFLRLLLFSVISLLFAHPAGAQRDLPPAVIENDEGGVAIISGNLEYTNLNFTVGVAQPIIILEDQAGFIDRNRYYLFPPESQTLGQLTSDFFESPVSYSLLLPVVPAGAYRDVDQDGRSDRGVQVFAVAYWNNTYGDPFLEERDLHGGGWSGAYASTIVSPDAADEGEIIGGKMIVYAPDDEQGFPNGFGADGLLFTDDDPIVRLPAGYTLVNLDREPFRFDRAREQVIHLHEPEGAALVDFSSLSYTAAFDEMVAMFRKEYAYSEFKQLEWDGLADRFRARFIAADRNNSAQEYLLALRDFYWSIPDGHMTFPISGPLGQIFQSEVAGGIGIGLRELDDGRMLVIYLLEGGPAQQAGVELGAEILTINDEDIADRVANTRPWQAPHSTAHSLRLMQLRYATRFPPGATVSLTYRNPGENEVRSLRLNTALEYESLFYSESSEAQSEGNLPVDFRFLADGTAYASIHSFSDNDVLTIQLWERLMRSMRRENTQALILDMRQNGGGYTFRAAQMAAHFFAEPLQLRQAGTYDDALDEFYFDPRGVLQMYLPDEDLRFYGEIIVLVGPNCASACEYFCDFMTRQGRATVIGHYPTAGMGAGQKRFLMPGGLSLQFSAARYVDFEGNIIVEGIGVRPNVRVPITQETTMATIRGEDPVLATAQAFLSNPDRFEIVQHDPVADPSMLPDTTLPNAPPPTVDILIDDEPQPIAAGDFIIEEIRPGERVRYSITLHPSQFISLWVSSMTLDPVIRLYSEGGALLAENDNQNANTLDAALLDLSFPTEWPVIVEVGSRNDSGFGQYTLRVLADEPSKP